MITDVAPLLPLLVGIPLLAAGAMVILHRVLAFQVITLFTVLGAMLLAGAGLLAFTADGTVIAHGTAGWPFGISIPLVADTFAALMLTTTAALTLVCSWFAVATGLHREPYFSPLVLILASGVFGAILTADVFNLFVFIEVMLLPSYGLFALTQSRSAARKAIEGLRLYVAVNLLASSILLAGIGFVYGTAGTVNLAELANAAQEDRAVAYAIAVVLVAIFIKASVVPLHTWLTRSYPNTSPAITALFSGLHTKVSVYIVYRLYAVVFDGDTRFLWFLVIVFSATMLFGVLGAVGENHSRNILVFHMVSQLGYILMGVALFTELGLTAGIFYLVHNMVVKAALFLSTGAVEHRYGSGRLGDVTGLAGTEPVIAVAFFVSALSMAGIPPFSGFVAKAALMAGAWQAGEVLALIIMVLVSVVTLLSMLKIWSGMFWGEEKEEDSDKDSDDESAREPGSVALKAKEKKTIGVALGAPAVILAVTTVVLGLGAEMLLGVSQTAAEGLLDTTAYVEAVRNS